MCKSSDGGKNSLVFTSLAVDVKTEAGNEAKKKTVREQRNPGGEKSAPSWGFNLGPFEY